MAAADEELYEMHFICGERHNAADNITEFQVKWKGWNAKFNTWEPEESIVDKTFIEAFREKRQCRSHDAQFTIATRLIVFFIIILGADFGNRDLKRFFR